MLFKVLNVIVIMTELTAIMYITRGFFRPQKGTFLYIFYFFILTVAVTLSSIILEKNMAIKALSSVILIGLWIYFCHESSLGQGVIVALLSVALQSMLDGVILLTGEHLIFAQESIYNDPQTYYILIFISKIVSLCIAVWLHQWAKTKYHNQYYGSGNWIRVSFIPLIVLIFGAYLLYEVEKRPEMAEIVVPCLVFLLVLDIMSILLLNYMESQQRAIVENIVLKQNLKIESEHIESLKELYSNQRKQTHDFNNQLAVLRSLAEDHASNNEFRDYLDTVLTVQFPEIVFIDTHRKVVDVILSQKITIAQNKKIHFEYVLEDLSRFPMADEAIVILLTNLLDNAIEACEAIEKAEMRYITLKVKIDEMYSIIYVENSVASPVIIKNNQIVSTKKDASSHGFGLKNVCKTIEEYSGQYAMIYDDEKRKFIFTVKIPM